MFYLTTHSTHFIYGYMASDIWLRTILIVREETCCHHIGYSFRLAARVLLYAPSHRQDSTYHGLCYTSCGALARNSVTGLYAAISWSHPEASSLFKSTSKARFILCHTSCQVRSGQVRSECLMCTFRASCCRHACHGLGTSLCQFLLSGTGKKKGEGVREGAGLHWWVQGSTSSPTGIGSRQRILHGQTFYFLCTYFQKRKRKSTCLYDTTKNAFYIGTFDFTRLLQSSD